MKQTDSHQRAVPRGVGQRARRIEDPALLAGRGRFLDDVRIDGVLHAAFARSPHAHARIAGIDTSAAEALPGVVAVFTARSLAPALTRARMPMGVPSTQYSETSAPFVLCPDETCFVGEAVALVVAESRYLAEDGVAALQIDWEPLAAIADCRDAVKPGAPRVRSDASSNVLVSFRVAYGDCDAVFGRLAAGARIFSAKLWQHRGAAHPMEGRGVIARHDAAEDKLTVWTSTQMSHEVYFTIADMLGMPETQVRVIAPDVGGGFGSKFQVYPEDIAIPAAARLLGRPVKWVEDRQEHFLSAIQARDQHWDVEIAAGADGRVLGVRGRMIHDQGAYTLLGIYTPQNAAMSITGPYVVPAYAMEVQVAQTNKTPVTPVRGAGYPEGAFVMERLLDRVAQGFGLDRAEVRRRNLIPAERMPYEKPMKNRTGSGIVLDSGDYLASQNKVLQAIGYSGFAERQRCAFELGRYIGIGFAHGVKGTGRGPFESGSVRVSPTGRVSVATGALAMGQGLKTALAQICAEQLGIDIAAIDVIAGDTAAVSLGIGGAGSRQTITAGSSVHLAAIEVRNKALQVAARALEVAIEDLELEGGKVRVKGTDHSIDLGDVAKRLRGAAGYALPDGVAMGLEASFMWRTETLTYANGFHACEVEVDAETGAVRVLRYVALQDSGRLVNPMMVEGQLHGGIVHGLGNALSEFMRFDAEGQPTSTTFADYLMTTATEVPLLEILFQESPTPLNPLGVKGVGESGIIPVVPAVLSAIEHALAPFGVRIDRAPVTPVYLLELIEAARARLAAPP
ncbi:MAG: xanthine dehydrogenase family protein molybdopterin-binding subunit [Betaproteobacteria bacterium]|nr:xanthine dehydrogenase family protein molybdopterin-binding subunit [Betaproteobacteria bacterium]